MDAELILTTLSEIHAVTPIDVLIEGEAKGADRLAAQAARKLGIPVLPFPAGWNKYGRAAGPVRNTQMLREGQPDYAVAFHDNLAESKGTRNMTEQLTRKGIPWRLVTHEE